MKLGFSKAMWVSDLIVFLAVLIATQFGPWWSFAIIAWVVGFDRRRKGFPAVLPTALIVVGSWIGLALVKDAYNGFRVSRRIGGFLGLPHGSLLYVAVGLLAFAIAFLAAASGDQLGRLDRAKSAR